MITEKKTGQGLVPSSSKTKGEESTLGRPNCAPSRDWKTLIGGWAKTTLCGKEESRRHLKVKRKAGASCSARGRKRRKQRRAPSCRQSRSPARRKIGMLNGEVTNPTPFEEEESEPGNHD